jgi:hypothetical protein
VTSRFCPHCGTPLSEDARFCKTCGMALNVPQQAQAAGATATSPAPGSTAEPGALPPLAYEAGPNYDSPYDGSSAPTPPGPAWTEPVEPVPQAAGPHLAPGPVLPGWSSGFLALCGVAALLLGGLVGYLVVQMVLTG